MSGYKTESRGKARIPPQALWLQLSACNIALAAQPVWAQNPDSQPSKVYPSHNESSDT